MKRNWIVLAIVAVLAGAAIYQHMGELSRKAAAPADSAPKVGFNAPAFELTALDGKPYRVGGERDKPVLVNFWASWCIPCQIEAPDIQALYEKFQGKFDLYAVNVTSQDTRKEAEAFAKTYGFTFPILLDQEGAALDAYRFQSIPTSFLVDRSGKITDVFHVLEPAELEKKLTPLIN
ncbi:TlpA family protein disulfide reductase [Paenibacillus sp. MBLB4367]|uniref:TlpA family protein disulfide reductase n=1 Tax=Paenibacillus sp. MBLB4367 TaxID=3384767 RepID=UPI00390823A3